MQPARDHQVQHQPDVVVEPDRDALAEPAQLAHDVTFHRGDRRIGRTQDERARQTHALELPSDNPRLEGTEIGADVRQLRHYSLQAYAFQVGLNALGANPCSAGRYA